MSIILQTVGWLGAAAILSAFALVSFSVLEGDSLAFHILNGAGAIGVVAVSLWKKAYPPAVLNGCWTVISLIAIVRIFL